MDFSSSLHVDLSAYHKGRGKQTCDHEAWGKKAEVVFDGEVWVEHFVVNHCCDEQICQVHSYQPN
jgi:hypothetical protein